LLHYLYSTRPVRKGKDSPFCRSKKKKEGRPIAQKFPEKKSPSVARGRGGAISFHEHIARRRRKARNDPPGTPKEEKENDPYFFSMTEKKKGARTCC